MLLIDSFFIRSLEARNIRRLLQLMSNFFSPVAGQLVLPKSDLEGQVLNLTGQCPLTCPYFEPCGVLTINYLIL